MPRSIVGQTSNDCNEVSVSSQSAEHLRASDSSQRAEQPSSEDSVEQFRLSAQRQAKELSKTGRHSTTYQISSAHHVQGEHLRYQSIVVQVSRIDLDLSLQRHILVAGHDTGNGRIEILIATDLAIEEAGTAHLRDHIIDLLGQTVTVVRAEVTLEMRPDVIVVLRQEIKLGMTEMIDLVVTIGHPTEMREINMTSLVEITTKITGSRCS